MKLFKRSIVAIGMAATAALALANPASADTNGPAVKYFKAPLPVVGSVLSSSSGTPNVSLKDGWAVNDADGICSAYTYYDGPSGYRQVWNAPSTGRSVTSLTGNTYTGSYLVGGYYNYLETYASDCLGNGNGWVTQYIYPRLDQEGAASYGPGWTTSSYTGYSGGTTMKSSTVGAKATYTFSGANIMSLVSVYGSDRGKVSLSMDGGTAKTVTLTKSVTKNRAIVWKSGYLNPSSSHLLTIKVVSGRVDIDGFLTVSVD